MHAPVTNDMLRRSPPAHTTPLWLRRLIRSNRLLLLGAIALSLLLAELAHLAMSPPGSAKDFFAEPEFWLAAAGITVSHLIIQNLSILPGANRTGITLATFFAVYGIIAIPLLALHSSADLYHMVASFALGLFWYALLSAIQRRFGIFRIALVPGTPFETAMLTSYIQWSLLPDTKLPGNLSGIAYDSTRSYSPAWQRLFRRAVLRSVAVHDIHDLRERITGKVYDIRKPEREFGQLFMRHPYLRMKWAIGFAVAIPALLIALPIMGAAGLLIRLESPGPIIFRQRRIGYQGRIFTCYKLRTMRTDVEGPLYTNEDDPRVTPTARIIRKYRIDELPQIFNILRGDMSWIGPRPEAVRLARHYEKNNTFYAYRHTVRPGITGWAAVHQGNVALGEAAAEKLSYDFYYLKYLSVWLDCMIIAKTIRTVLTGFGSR